MGGAKQFERRPGIIAGKEPFPWEHGQILQPKSGFADRKCWWTELDCRPREGIAWPLSAAVQLLEKQRVVPAVVLLEHELPLEKSLKDAMIGND